MADEKDTDIDQGKTQESAAETTAQEQGKTFTQAEVDKIISDRLKREREKLPNDDELKSYREWKKAQQSEAEKAAEREKEYIEIKNQLEALKHENLVIKAGVDQEDVDYVIYKVQKMGDNFEENLNVFLKENKKFIEKTAQISGTKHELSKSDAMDGVEKEFYRRNPALKK